jgi:hypothetical protein
MQIEQLEAELVPLRRNIDERLQAEALHRERASQVVALRARAKSLKKQISRARVEAAAKLFGAPRDSYEDLKPLAEYRAQPSTSMDIRRIVLSAFIPRARVVIAGGLFFVSLLVLKVPVVLAATLAGLPSLLLILRPVSWREEGL